MSEFFGKTLKALNYKKLLPYLVLVVLLALSVLAWQYYKDNTVAQEERRYYELVDGIVSDIVNKISGYEIVLHGGAGVFTASEEVTRDDWKAYCGYQQTTPYYPGIQGIGYSQAIQPAELEHHIQSIRAEGFPDYAIRPTGERDEYTAIIFLEPFDARNQRAFGYDMFSEPVRRIAMERARDSGSTSISGMVTLVQEYEEDIQQGFLMYIPIYKKNEPLGSPEQRKAAFKGYVYAPFRVRDLMQGIFTDPVREIDFELYDGTEISAETMLYDSHVTPEEDRERRPLFTSTETIDLYGHQWTMVFESRPAFEALANRYLHWTILGAGLLISFLIFFYLKSVQNMNATISKSEGKHRRLFETMDQGVVYQAADGRIISANPAAEKCLGLTFDQMQGNTSMGPRWQMIEEDGTPVPGEEHPAMIALRTSQTGGPVTRGVYRPDSASYCWLRITAIPLFRPGEAAPFQVNSVYEDITARKQLEEQINESRKKYKSVVDAQQEMISRYLPDATLTFVNDAYCRVFGKSRSELLGQKYLMFLPPETHEEEIESLNSLTPANPNVTKEFSVLLSDGSAAWQEWTDQALFDEKGKVIEIQGVGRDITRRKQAEIESLRQAYRAEALLKVSSRLNAELELDRVRNAICEETCSALHTQMAAFLCYDSNTRLFHLTASLGLPEELARVFASLSRDDYDTLIKKVGKYGAISDLAAVPELPYAQPLLNHNIRSFASAVIERDELPLGVVFTGNVGDESDLPEDATALLSGLANQAASAVTNARLLQETRESLRQVQALRNIDMAITGSFDLRVTFQVVLDEVTGMLNTDAAAILLFDPHSSTLRYEQWRGFHSKDLKSIILPLGKGYVGRVAMERQSIHIADLSKVETDPVQEALLAKEGFAAYFAVPLIAKGTLRGVLEVYHREPVEASVDWLAFLETLAGQAAIAVDNAELLSRLEHSSADLLQAYNATIEGWARALDLKDEETEGHSRRVTEMTVELARKMNIKDAELAHVRRGALLHDIGKMGLPDAILLKPGKLNDEEWEIVKKHPVYAYEMLAPVDYLRPALEIPYCHHEKWDGSGYPRGLKGEEIPLPARIFAVVDVYDALTSDRPYRKAWSREETLEHIKKDSGSHFDPEVVEVFLKEFATEV